jgi:hypothetical protein
VVEADPQALKNRCAVGPSIVAGAPSFIFLAILLQAPAAGEPSSGPVSSPVDELVTHLLHAPYQGDPHAAGRLLPRVYEKLPRRLGHRV